MKSVLFLGLLLASTAALANNYPDPEWQFFAQDVKDHSMFVAENLMRRIDNPQHHPVFGVPVRVISSDGTVFPQMFFTDCLTGEWFVAYGKNLATKVQPRPDEHSPAGILEKILCGTST